MKHSVVEEFSEKIFRFLKVFGMSSFSIESGKSVTKALDVFFLLANLLIACSLLYGSVKYQHLFGTSDSEILELGNFVTYVSSVLVVITVMIMNFINRHKMWRIVQAIAKVDQILLDLDVKKDFRKAGVKVLVILPIIMSLALPVNYLVYISSRSLLKASLYMYTLFYFMLVVAILVGFKVGTYLRFKGMIASLERQSTVGTINKCDHVKKTDVELVGSLIDIYDTMVVISSSISEICGFLILLGFGLSFFHGIFTNFMLFKDWKDDGTFGSLTISSFCFEVYNHIFVFFVLFVCELNKKEVQKLLKTSNKILNQAEDEVLVAMLMSLNSFVERNPPIFSCGLFDFEWGLSYSVSYFSLSIELCPTDLEVLVFQMIAAGFTNVVILIQFDNDPRLNITLNDTRTLH